MVRLYCGTEFVQSGTINTFLTNISLFFFSVYLQLHSKIARFERIFGENVRITQKNIYMYSAQGGILKKEMQR